MLKLGYEGYNFSMGEDMGMIITMTGKMKHLILLLDFFDFIPLYFLLIVGYNFSMVGDMGLIITITGKIGI